MDGKTQKGTAGILLKHSDMPFTKDGITPDIIVNTNAIPSRMTLGQVVECLVGKVAAIRGTEADGTPFNNIDIETAKQALEKLGYNREGTEVMYNGMTGQELLMEIFIGPTYYQRLKHLVEDKIHCILSSTCEVLTLEGWKKTDEITMDSRIACLEGGLELVYRKPLNVYRYPEFEGDLYHIETQQIDLTVTMEHRMWVSKVYGRQKEWLDPTFEFAKDIIGKHRKYQKDAEWLADDYQFILPTIENHKAKKVNMEAWLTFFGIWMAEGFATNTEKSNENNSYRTCVCVCKPRVYDAIKTSLATLEYKYSYSEQESNNSKNVTISNKQLWNYMKDFSLGAPNKQLPSWVWQLSQRQCRTLLESMILGDGSYHGSTVRYYTSSIKLADDVMQLALHCGWSANKWLHIKAGAVNTIRGEEVTTLHDIWRLGIVKTKNNPEVNHGHIKTQDGQLEEVIKNYKGEVFCLEVPQGVFYVRSNGKACWTGNSRARGPRTLLTRQPPEGNGFSSNRMPVYALKK